MTTSAGWKTLYDDSLGIIGKAATFHSIITKATRDSVPMHSILITVGEFHGKYAPPETIISDMAARPQHAVLYIPPEIGISKKMIATEDVSNPSQSIFFMLSLNPAVGGLDGKKMNATRQLSVPSGASK